MIWPRKPKTPGFGISRNFYVTVLAARATLPPPLAVANPKGEGDAAAGFIVPLAAGASKEDLGRPMLRGAYGISSPDRKTVLRMLVLSKEEVGFDPGPFLRSEQAIGLSPELLARISATWTLLQLTFESHEPMVYDAVRFMLSVAKRLADLTEGVVSDPITESYRLPEDVFAEGQFDPRIDVRDVVRVWVRPSSDRTLVNAYTLGLQKFGLPELELNDLKPENAGVAERFLYRVAQGILLGELVDVGDRLGSDSCLLQVVPGGLDRARWEGIPCLELIPPTGSTVDDALVAWLAEG